MRSPPPSRPSDYVRLKDELGDLLLQVVFHAQMAEEEACSLRRRRARDLRQDDPPPSACLRRRRRQDGRGRQTVAWDEIKRRERAAKPASQASMLDDVPRALPALMRAIKLQNRAAEVGFDWPNRGPLSPTRSPRKPENWPKPMPQDNRASRGRIRRSAVCDGQPRAAFQARSGRRAARRQCQIRPPFQGDRSMLAAPGPTPEHATLEEMEALWQEAKAAER